MHPVSFAPSPLQAKYNRHAGFARYGVGADQVHFGATRAELLKQQRRLEQQEAHATEDTLILQAAQSEDIQKALKVAVLNARGIVPAVTLVDLLKALAPLAQTFEENASPRKGQEAFEPFKKFLSDLSDDGAEHFTINWHLKNSTEFESAAFLTPILGEQGSPIDSDSMNAGKLIGYKLTPLALKALEVYQANQK